MGTQEPEPACGAELLDQTVQSLTRVGEASEAFEDRDAVFFDRDADGLGACVD